MATDLTGLKVQNTYNALLKIGDNSDLTGIAKVVSDGVGHQTVLYLSTSQVGIGGVPDAGVGLHVHGNVKVGNIETTGYLRAPATFTIDPAAHGDDTGVVVIAGDLRVDGTTTTINSTVVSVDDKNILLGDGATADSDNNGAGITILRPSLGSTNSYVQWNETTDQWDFSHAINFTNNDTDDLGEGSTNLYYTDTRFDNRLSTKTTDNLSEGSTNLYFTTARARASFSGGTGVTITSGSIAIGQNVGTTDNVTFGNVTGNSFIKSGGTSSQFLKADGSVDSSTYLTSYTETDTLQSVTDRGATTTNDITIGDGTAANNLYVKYSDGSYSQLRGTGLYLNRTTSYIRPTTDATTTLYIGFDDGATINNPFLKVRTYAVTHEWYNDASERMTLSSAGDLDVTRDITAVSFTGNVFSTNGGTTPDIIGGVKIARLHGDGGTAISSIDNLDTFILSKKDGSYGSGTKPTGSNNAFGVISLQTHSGNYYTQLGLDTNQNQLWIRSANGTTTFGSWETFLNSGNYEGVFDAHYLRSDEDDTMTGNLTVVGNVQATTARLTTEGQANLTSTAHGFQIGDGTTTDQLLIDNNTMMVRNNGAGADMFLNSYGGDVFVGVQDANTTLYVTNNLYSVIHSGNIGSQSVNYATTAGSATTATNADTVDSKHATDFTLQYVTDNGASTTNDITAKSFRTVGDTADNNNARFTVFESGSYSYGMTLWNSNGTVGEWGTMIYTGNGSDRRISFGKANATFPSNHASIDELAYIDGDNGNFISTGGASFAGDISKGELRIGTHPFHTAYTGLWNSERIASANESYLIISQGTDTYINGNNVYIRGGNNSTANQLLVNTSGVTIGGNTVWHSGNDNSLLKANVDDQFYGNLTTAADNHITFGPNTTWGSSLRIGGNGHTATGTEMASVVTTDGNLHLDAANSTNAIYLNFYAGTGGVKFGNGSGSSVVANMNSSGQLYYGSGSSDPYWRAGNDGVGSGLNADLLDGAQLTGQNGIFNNMNDNHTKNQSFAEAYAEGYGVRYVQQSPDGPTGTTNHQWYGFYMGLGSDYNNYGSMLYWGRQNQSGNNPYLWARDLESGTWGSWRKFSAGYADTAGTFSTNRTNYKGVTDGAVSGQLMWKHYGNNHTIIDASNGTAPDGTSINNTNSTYAWTSTYPTLVGWNGSDTYGVRVDSARLADTATNSNSLGGVAAINYLRSDTSDTMYGILTIQATNPYIQWKNASGTRLGYIQHNETDFVMSADTGAIIMDGRLEGTYNTATGLSNGSFNVAKTTLGSIHIINGSGPSANAGYQGAITFMGNSTSEAQAGIYVHNNNSYGTAMAFATTQSYSTGPQIFLNADATGNVTFPRGQVTGNYFRTSGYYSRSNAGQGYLDGGYSSVETTTSTHPIYCISASYAPNPTNLGNMYGIGYALGGSASFITLPDASGWGQYVSAGGTANIFLDASYGHVIGSGTISGTSIKTRTATNGFFGSLQASWSGSTTYPTLYSESSDRWIMHVNPHISYTKNGYNGFSGSMEGSTIRFASNYNAPSYWDLGVGTNSVGADVFAIGRAGARYFDIDSLGYHTINPSGWSSPNRHAALNIGYNGSGQTRAIDIDGNWSANESKAITWTHGSASSNIVGQIDVQHNGPGSRIRWGKLYHSGDSSTYTMELVSTSTTTADLYLKGSTYIDGNVDCDSVGDFGPNSGNNQGIGIRCGSGSGDYGRVRFYFNGYNQSTIHAFSDIWSSGTATSRGCINIDGHYGVTIGSWSSPDALFLEGGASHFNNDVIAYSTTISDAKFKDEVETIPNALDKVKALRGVSYVWNNGSRKGKRDLGVIAQEVEQVLPEIVHEHEMPLMGTGDEKHKTVDYEKMVGVLIEAVKELSAEVESLKKQIK